LDTITKQLQGALLCSIGDGIDLSVNSNWHINGSTEQNNIRGIGNFRFLTLNVSAYNNDLVSAGDLIARITKPDCLPENAEGTAYGEYIDILTNQGTLRFYGRDVKVNDPNLFGPTCNAPDGDCKQGDLRLVNVVNHHRINYAYWGSGYTGQ
jgi:hypothetical protein